MKNYVNELTSKILETNKEKNKYLILKIDIS